MIDNKERIGSFTSSQIYKLIKQGSRPMTEQELVVFKKDNPTSRKKNIDDGFAELGLTYIQEKQIERRMGRSLEVDAYSRDMTWGLFLEQRVHSFLFDNDYKLLSKETKSHPTIGYWSGSADLVKAAVKVGDIKCYQPKNFALLTDAILLQDIENFKSKFPKEYWQLVSNAIIHGVPNAESISYMPYQSELNELRESADSYDDPGNEWKYRFITESLDNALAYLPDNGYYNNLNRFEFEIPQQDKDFLTSRVIEAGKLLLGTGEIKQESPQEFNINKLKKIN